MNSPAPLRQLGDLKEVSRGAVYKISGRGPDSFNVDNAHLLSARPPQVKQHAFHSAENADQPHVVIKLTKPVQVSALQIANRMTKDNALLARAKGLTVWTSADNQSWKKVWKAESVESKWVVKMEGDEKILFLKIGLARRGTLHLNQIVVYGE